MLKPAFNIYQLDLNHSRLDFSLPSEIYWLFRVLPMNIINILYQRLVLFTTWFPLNPMKNEYISYNSVEFRLFPGKFPRKSLFGHDYAGFWKSANHVRFLEKRAVPEKKWRNKSNMYKKRKKSLTQSVQIFGDFQRKL